MPLTKCVWIIIGTQINRKADTYVFQFQSCCSNLSLNKILEYSSVISVCIIPITFFVAHFMYGVKRQPTRLGENFLGNWNTNYIYPSVSTTLYIINFALYNRTLVRYFINPFSIPYLFGSANNYIKSKCYGRCSMQTLGPWSEMWFCQFSLAAGLYY